MDVNLRSRLKFMEMVSSFYTLGYGTLLLCVLSTFRICLSTKCGGGKLSSFLIYISYKDIPTTVPSVKSVSRFFEDLSLHTGSVCNPICPVIGLDLR